MEKRFHELVPLILLARMPVMMKFFEKHVYRYRHVKEDAVRPDEVYKDNIIQNGEIHHAHSYKLEPDETGRLRWKDGDCLETLKGRAALSADLYRSGEYRLCCRFLCELTHYAVDAMTYPHLVHGRPWSDYHAHFEVEMARWLDFNYTHLDPIAFEPVHDIYKSAADEARALYPQAIDLVNRYVNGGQLSDAEMHALSVRIVKQVGCYWLTISQAFGEEE
jgi:hypothetical protein